MVFDKEMHMQYLFYKLRCEFSLKNFAEMIIPNI